MDKLLDVIPKRIDPETILLITLLILITVCYGMFSLLKRIFLLKRKGK